MVNAICDDLGIERYNKKIYHFHSTKIIVEIFKIDTFHVHLSIRI